MINMRKLRWDVSRYKQLTHKILRNRMKYEPYFKQKFNYLIEKFDRQ